MQNLLSSHKLNMEYYQLDIACVAKILYGDFPLKFTFAFRFIDTEAEKKYSQ